MHISQSFAPEPQSVRRVRSFVRSVLRAGGASENAVEDAVLLASEVAGNVVRHAQTEYEVTIDAGAQVARIEFHDGSSVLPAVRDLGITAEDEEDGRGLAIVSTLSLEWGMRQRPRGKVVWFVVSLAAEPEVEDASPSTTRAWPPRPDDARPLVD